MAQRTRIELIDDLDGSEAEESIEFCLDGVQYSIDLSDENAEKLREALSEFIDAGTRLGGRRKRKPATSGRAGTPGAVDREQTKAIREWARNQGYEISDRGRIPRQIVQEYHAS